MSLFRFKLYLCIYICNTHIKIILPCVLLFHLRPNEEQERPKARTNSARAFYRLNAVSACRGRLERAQRPRKARRSPTYDLCIIMSFLIDLKVWFEWNLILFEQQHKSLCLYEGSVPAQMCKVADVILGFKTQHPLG